MQPIRIGVLVVSAIVAASALWGVWDAVGREPQVWALLGFEIVTLVAGVLGILVGLGKFREAPALSVFSVAGVVFASAMLGRFSAIVTRTPDSGSGTQAVRQMLRDPMFDGRMLAVGVFGVLALFLAFGRDSRSWKALFGGIVSAALMLAGLAWAMGPGRPWLLGPVETAADVARVIGTLVGAMVLVVLASIAVHLLVRAFELRLPPIGVSGAAGSRRAVARKSDPAKPKKSA
ncbi:MAG: hypothetical protein Q9O74_08705 [Planctomycetota bacterium]|nr:hypothetical protein [Planctomycetota bacterium]